MATSSRSVFLPSGCMVSVTSMENSTQVILSLNSKQVVNSFAKALNFWQDGQLLFIESDKSHEAVAEAGRIISVLIRGLVEGYRLKMPLPDCIYDQHISFSADHDSIFYSKIGWVQLESGVTISRNPELNSSMFEFIFEGSHPMLIAESVNKVYNAFVELDDWITLSLGNQRNAIEHKNSLINQFLDENGYNSYADEANELSNFLEAKRARIRENRGSGSRGPTR